MGFSEDQLLLWFSQYAHSPMLVYSIVVGLMIASSFGLPVPEEITLVSVGLVAYMGSRPDLFPPPYEGAPVVDVTTAAIVCFFAVFISDYLVFSLGKYFGTRLVKTKFLQKHQAAFDRVSLWVKKYGMWAAGIFRFTPGLRFPGHFSCGMLGLKPSRFIMVDGAAALISVPTQVILIASFGEQILGIIKEAKIVMFSVLAVIVIVVLARKYMKKRQGTV